MKANSALNIYAALGVYLSYEKAPYSSQHTKSGPGRIHLEGNGTRTAQQRRAGAFGRGLRNEITRKNVAKLRNQRKVRHG